MGVVVVLDKRSMCHSFFSWFHPYVGVDFLGFHSARACQSGGMMVGHEEPRPLAGCGDDSFENAVA